MEGKSKITNVEWGLLIGVLFLIDLTQIGLEWILIGFFINPFIDIIVGMGLAFYLHTRGQSIANPKRLAGLVGTFIGEMIPVVAELPLWTLDGIFNMVISKSDEIMSKIPGTTAGEVYQDSLSKSQERTGSIVDRVNTGTEQIRALNESIKTNRNQP